MNQGRLDEINRIYHSSGRGLMWDTIRELIAEVERLRKEVNALENKPLNLYLDRELENERLEAEVERLRAYTDQKLFAAASNVLQAWEDYNQTNMDYFTEAMDEYLVARLTEAVAWWDSLPFDPAKDVEQLPKYEG